MEIRRLGPGDTGKVLEAAHLFDEPADAAAAERFLVSEGHHIFIAYEEGRPAGFVTGVEMTHPDKGMEMFLYELGVDEQFRRRGIGRALVAALRELAVERGCYGMWVLTEIDNEAALATYRSSGAGPDEERPVLLSWSFDHGT